MTLSNNQSINQLTHTYFIAIAITH